MPIMINSGNEMIRISPKDNKNLEYSTNGGRTWNMRCSANSSRGSFIDLVDAGNELLATCEKGLFYSTNAGRTWNFRHR